MSCCGPRKRRPENLTTWNFSNGTTVYAEDFDMAMNEMKNVGSRNFWASETTSGLWDVQLSDSVVLFNIQAKSVLEAVKTARWKVHLDSSIKKVNSIS